MPKQTITFTIRPDGTVEELTSGIKGEACEQVTAAVETALGLVTHREPTAERYEEPEAQAGEARSGEAG